ncbi:MAG TPA: LUD domain-containing protein, partial [Thermomicrobiales bacterium]|nr:LUD domain-containing protein [Thermomicrobiales bacterium]
MSITDGEGRRGFGWGKVALAVAVGGAAFGSTRAARRALLPPDQRDQDGNPLAHEGEAPEPFAERYEQALGDDRQRAGLLRFQRHWRVQRDASFARYEEATGRSFAEMRDRLAAVKDAVIANPDTYFAQFKAAAERNGAVVYESTSAEDANHYIVELCARHGVRVVDKSKSMVSEETGLNHYLEARGIHVAETDLGEWLVQL